MLRIVCKKMGYCKYYFIVFGELLAHCLVQLSLIQSRQMSQVVQHLISRPIGTCQLPAVKRSIPK